MRYLPYVEFIASMCSAWLHMGPTVFPYHFSLIKRSEREGAWKGLPHLGVRGQLLCHSSPSTLFENLFFLLLLLLFCCVNQGRWPASFWDCPVSAFHLLVVMQDTYTVCSAFKWDQGIWTEVLKLLWQALYTTPSL